MRKKKTIIHVNQHHIKHNRAHPLAGRKPVLTCKTYKNNVRGNRATIIHNGVVVGVFRYEPDQPLPCGAHVWFETMEQVDVRIN
jgi:hypothetical protein